MARRVLSVVCRYGAASIAALCLALACLNPQNDDLPSSEDDSAATPNGPVGATPTPTSTASPDPLPAQGEPGLSPPPSSQLPGDNEGEPTATPGGDMSAFADAGADAAPPGDIDVAP
jgi:hypothetical protein